MALTPCTLRVQVLLGCCYLQRRKLVLDVAGDLVLELLEFVFATCGPDVHGQFRHVDEDSKSLAVIVETTGSHEPVGLEAADDAGLRVLRESMLREVDDVLAAGPAVAGHEWNSIW